MFLSRRGFVGGAVAITLASSTNQPAIGKSVDDLAAPENLLRLYRAMLAERLETDHPGLLSKPQL